MNFVQYATNIEVDASWSNKGLSTLNKTLEGFELGMKFDTRIPQFTHYLIVYGDLPSDELQKLREATLFATEKTMGDANPTLSNTEITILPSTHVYSKIPEEAMEFFDSEVSRVDQEGGYIVLENNVIVNDIELNTENMFDGLV